MAAPLRRRLMIMLALRMVLILAVGGFTSHVFLVDEPGVFSPAYQKEGYVVVFLVAGLGLSGAYAGWLRWNRHLRALAWTQIVLDQLLFSFVVYLTGGPTSGATSLYGLTCLAGAVVLGQRASLTAAGIGHSQTTRQRFAGEDVSQIAVDRIEPVVRDPTDTVRTSRSGRRRVGARRFDRLAAIAQRCKQLEMRGQPGAMRE